MTRTNESPTQDTNTSEEVLTLTEEEIQLLSTTYRDEKLPHVSPRCKLNDVDLDGVILSDAEIKGTLMYEAKLVGAWLSRANLSNARLSKADASRAVFYETDLTEAEFYKANLTSAHFTGAILERTRMLDSNLTGAYFFRARLNNTEIMASQIGQAIGEEKDRLYSEAIEAYSCLNDGNLSSRAIRFCSRK